MLKGYPEHRKLICKEPNQDTFESVLLSPRFLMSARAMLTDLLGVRLLGARASRSWSDAAIVRRDGGTAMVISCLIEVGSAALIRACEGRVRSLEIEQAEFEEHVKRSFEPRQPFGGREEWPEVFSQILGNSENPEAASGKTPSFGSPPRAHRPIAPNVGFDPLTPPYRSSA